MNLKLIMKNSFYLREIIIIDDVIKWMFETFQMQMILYGL